MTRTDAMRQLLELSRSYIRTNSCFTQEWLDTYAIVEKYTGKMVIGFAGIGDSNVSWEDPESEFVKGSVDLVHLRTLMEMAYRYAWSAEKEHLQHRRKWADVYVTLISETGRLNRYQPIDNKLSESVFEKTNGSEYVFCWDDPISETRGENMTRKDALRRLLEISFLQCEDQADGQKRLQRNEWRRCWQLFRNEVGYSYYESSKFNWQDPQDHEKFSVPSEDDVQKSLRSLLQLACYFTHELKTTTPALRMEWSDLRHFFADKTGKLEDYDINNHKFDWKETITNVDSRTEYGPLMLAVLKYKTDTSKNLMLLPTEVNTLKKVYHFIRKQIRDQEPLGNETIEHDGLDDMIFHVLRVSKEAVIFGNDVKEEMTTRKLRGKIKRYAAKSNDSKPNSRNSRKI